MKLPLLAGHDARLLRLRAHLRLTGGTALAVLLAFLAGTANGAAQPRRIAFSVTLKATVTKQWDAVTQTTENGCPTTHGSFGRRTVTLRSTRPTTVFVTFRAGRVLYAPAVVRFVAGALIQTGEQATRIESPCTPGTTHSPCARKRRAVGGLRFRFFRSARNEISFRPAQLPEFSSACPPESAEVREIRPGLQEAQGELSEGTLKNVRVPKQTAVATSDVETDLEDQETGTVVERVHWELTFARKR